MQQKTTMNVLMLVAIFFVAINLRPAITSIGPLLTTIAADLQVTNTQMSLLTSIPVFCMGVFASLAMPLTKRFGDRQAIALLILLIGIATFIRLAVPSYSVLVVTSFLAGVGIAAIAPIINSFIKKRFPQKTATVIGVYSFGIGFGATISVGLTTVFYDWTATWTFALGIWGILAVVAMIIWLVATTSQPIVEQVSVNDSFTGRNPWKSKQAWMILLFFGVQTSLFFSMTTWFVPIAQQQGFSLAAASGLLTVVSLVQLVGNLMIPIWLETYPNRIRWITILTCIALLGGILMLIGGTMLIWIGAIFIGISVSGLFPIGLLLPLDAAKNEQEANEWSSMVMSGGFMISAIIPLLIGVLYDATGTHQTSIWMLIVQVVLLGCMIPLMKRAK